MKCRNCGFENSNKAKFCSKCGSSLNQVNVNNGNVQNSNTSKYVIIALLAVIIILIACVGYFALNNGSGEVSQSDSGSQIAAPSQVEDDAADNEKPTTQSVSSSKETTTSVASESKSWVSIGKYSGSGSGTETIDVPEGKIMVKLSAYPIKNYATNHLYVSGSNGESGGVDWGSTSAVKTKSDSFTYTSSSHETFTIDYYETVSWEVEFFSYQ